MHDRLSHIDDSCCSSDGADVETGSPGPSGPRTCSPAVKTARFLFHQRRLRDRYFDGELFRDPAWDILLDLFVAADLGRKISVSSACGAAGVPPATALRWLAKLEKSGSITRVPHGTDGRTVYVELTPPTREKMTGLLTRIAFDTGRIN